MTEQFPPSGYPGTQPTAASAPRARHRRKSAFIAGGCAVALVIAGIAAFLGWPDSSEPGVPHGPATLAATFSLPGNATFYETSFSPDGKFLALTTHSGTSIDILDIATRTYRAILPVPDGGASGTIGFSADDNQVTVIDADEGVLRWNVSTGARSDITPARAGVGSALSGDGDVLATADSADQGSDVWDLRTHRLIADLAAPDGQSISAASLDNSGQTLAVAGGSRVYIWNVPQRKVIATFRYPPGTDATSAVPILTADGKDLEIMTQSGSVTFWDIATQANVTPLDARWPRQSFAIDLATAGAICATQHGGDEFIDLWNIATRSYLLSAGSPRRDPGFLLSVGASGHELLTTPRGRAQAHQFSLWDIP